MVAGVIAQIAVSVVVLCATCYAIGAMYLKGYFAGMRKEAVGWIEAIEKIKPPNWQSLPIAGRDQPKEKIEETNKLYVATFKVALDVIKEEIAQNRLAALAEDVKKGTVLERAPGGAK